jgi:AbrB family looped-hinge helix DNA binding protein
MNYARVSSKGQIVIPEKLRRKYGITKGTQLSIEETEDALILHPVTPDYLDRLAGILKEGPSPTQMLLEEREQDKLREDRSA